MAMLVLGVYYFVGGEGQGKVYICSEQQFSKYHIFESCEGLKSCSDKTVAVDKIFAEDSLQRSPCGYCKSAYEELEYDESLDNLRP